MDALTGCGDIEGTVFTTTVDVKAVDVPQLFTALNV
jgi:hypothetical protein